MNARRPWAWPLVPLYRASVAAEAGMYSSGMLRSRRLGWPVVSVGSLSAGGAGKTPVVIALASMLRDHGWHVDVLSRGYGRGGKGVERVTNLETSDAATKFGDEPVLIAERTGVSVWVGADRFAAGELAEAETHAERPSSVSTRRVWRDRTEDRAERATFDSPVEKADTPVHLHLLDDGFQHRRLQRDFDIVLITAEDLNDALIPAGNLREPLTALRRADAIVVREEEREATEERLREITAGKLPVWSIRRKLRFPAPLGVFSSGLRPLAFCAIARPEGFADMLKAAGCGIVDTVFFPDHHAYSMRDMDKIVELAKQFEASGLVTTEKDAVKLTPAMRERLESIGPLTIAPLDSEFVFQAPVIRALEQRLRAPSRHRETHTPPQAREARLR